MLQVPLARLQVSSCSRSPDPYDRLHQPCSRSSLPNCRGPPLPHTRTLTQWWRSHSVQQILSPSCSRGLPPLIQGPLPKIGGPTPCSSRSSPPSCRGSPHSFWNPYPMVEVPFHIVVPPQPAAEDLPCHSRTLTQWGRSHSMQEALPTN